MSSNDVLPSLGLELGSELGEGGEQRVLRSGEKGVREDLFLGRLLFR